MAVKKNKLLIAPFDDIHIVGVNATLVDYKLAYHLNQKLSFNFMRLPDILLDESNPYAFFYYNAGENRNAYNLVSLRYKDNFCVKLNPRIDFLFIIRNPINQERLDQIVRGLREIKGVNHAYVMELSRTPAVDVLLERIEMHESQCLGAQNQA